jgi:hypothetical protein
MPRMADLNYCVAADVIALAGELAVDLRSDDVPDLDAHIDAAISASSSRIDFYCARYSETELAANRWVKGAAALLAVRWICQRRLNDVPASIEAEWEERRAELQAILDRKAEVPRAARSRRPITVTNSVVDLNRRNNQVRVDRNRSTGVANDYKRPTDPTAPDER